MANDKLTGEELDTIAKAIKKLSDDGVESSSRIDSLETTSASILTQLKALTEAVSALASAPAPAPAVDKQETSEPKTESPSDLPHDILEIAHTILGTAFTFKKVKLNSLQFRLEVYPPAGLQESEGAVHANTFAYDTEADTYKLWFQTVRTFLGHLAMKRGLAYEQHNNKQ